MRDLEALLNSATYDQKQPLVAILDTHFCSKPSTEEIVFGIQWLHRNIFEMVQRDASGKSESYAEVLQTLLKKLGISSPRFADCALLEELLVKSIFQAMWLQLNAKQQKDAESTISTVISTIKEKREWFEVGGIAGAMVAAKLGGFGTYMLASSAISGLGNVAAITIPFGVYKSVSSALSVALGPLGWLGLTIFSAYKLTGTNYQKLIPAAMYIALLRNELAFRPNKIVDGQVIPYGYASKRGMRLL